jgi:hypothetical protein
MARSESMGRPIEARDAFIAATAQVHGLTPVTRNTSDFKPTLKAIMSPLDVAATGFQEESNGPNPRVHDLWNAFDQLSHSKGRWPSAPYSPHNALCYSGAPTIKRGTIGFIFSMLSIYARILCRSEALWRIWDRPNTGSHPISRLAGHSRDGEPQRKPHMVSVRSSSIDWQHVVCCTNRRESILPSGFRSAAPSTTHCNRDWSPADSECGTSGTQRNGEHEA